MSADRMQDRSKKDLVKVAKRRGVARADSLNKEQLIKALARINAKATKPSKVMAKVAAKTVRRIAEPSLKIKKQRAAARDTQHDSSAEEQVERSKFDVGVPTKDLSKKLPRDLP